MPMGKVDKKFSAGARPASLPNFFQTLWADIMCSAQNYINCNRSVLSGGGARKDYEIWLGSNEGAGWFRKAA